MCRSARFSSFGTGGYESGSVFIWGQNDEAFGKIQGIRDTRQPSAMDSVPFKAKKVCKPVPVNEILSFA